MFGQTEPTSGIVGGPGVDIGFIGAGENGGVSNLFGGSAGRRLLNGNFNVSVLRPCLDGFANPAKPGEAAPVVCEDGQTRMCVGDRRPINPYATLLRDEWKQFDDTVMQVARERLATLQYFLGRGLRYNLPNALGTMTLEWEQMVGDLVDAEVTMSGLNEATKDRLGFTNVSMPIPIFHKEFFYNLRHLEAARRNGRNVETNHAQEATRKVAELIERTIFNGLTIAGGNIYGLTTHPNRKTVAMGTSWTTDTGPNIVADVNAAIDLLALPPNNMEGPYVLFVARAHRNNMLTDFKADGDDTILERVQGIEEISDVFFTNRLTSGALLVQLTSDVFEIVDGLAPTLVEWDSHAGFQHNFKLFAIQLPRVRSTGDLQTGIAHIS
jgi:uncharacterized linocin/CFP29 family protein